MAIERCFPLSKRLILSDLEVSADFLNYINYENMLLTHSAVIVSYHIRICLSSAFITVNYKEW